WWCLLRTVRAPHSGARRVRRHLIASHAEQQPHRQRPEHGALTRPERTARRLDVRALPGAVPDELPRGSGTRAAEGELALRAGAVDHEQSGPRLARRGIRPGVATDVARPGPAQHLEEPDAVLVPAVVVDRRALGIEPEEGLETVGAPGAAAVEAAGPQRRVLVAQGQQVPDGLAQVLLPRGQVPVHPGDLVVLAVGVVVAPLAAADLVARREH